MMSWAFSDVVVATDSYEIYREVESWGGSVMMTNPAHKCGTDRCWEVAQIITPDIIVNLQGDEPGIRWHDSQTCYPENTTRSIRQFLPAICDGQIVTMYDVGDPTEEHNRVSITMTQTGLEFNRGDIMKHVGIYGFTYDTLGRFASLPQSKRETEQHLEQLRALDNGIPIVATEINRHCHAIDTPEDWAEFKTFVEKEQV
jgi:3-deoxy-manno-octulosonate cytidylyltransferase (CMP-KDO synthetase)